MARNKHIFPFGFVTANAGKVAVYKITAPDNSIYIGRSRDVYKRLRDHALSRNANHGLKASIDKNGWGSHKIDTLHELPADVSDTVLDDYEEIYLEQHRDTGFKILNDYSARQGKGRRISEGAKLKMREKKLGGKQSAEQIQKRTAKVLGTKRRPKSDEAKKKISDKLRGVKFTPERLQALRENRKPVSDETRKRLSDKAKQQWAKKKGGNT